MKNLFDPRYIQAAIQGLNQARITKGEGIGLFSATRFNPDKCKTKLTSGESQENANNYSLAWVRDTLKCSLYDFLAENYIQSRLTISTLIKYFRKNTGIIDLTIDSYHRKESLRHDLHVIMPRMHPITLAPVHADKAKDLQLDMAEILKYIALLTYKNVWTPSCFDEISIIEKLIRYFLAWNYSLNSKIPGDFGIWEEGRGGTTGSAIPEIHTSTIGAMVSGLLAINGCRMKAPNNTFYTISVDESEISKGISLVNDRLITVGETESRKYDLASLIMLYDHLLLGSQLGKKFLSDTSIEIILSSIEKLEREKGFIRYASEDDLDGLDNYYKDKSPTGKSAEWTMGFGYAALIYSHLGIPDKAYTYIEKMESTFDWNTGLGLPEAYYGGTSHVVPVSPLSWSNALYLMAYETMQVNELNSIK